MTSYEQGVREGISGLFDRESADPAYLAGVRVGLLTYAQFLASTEDHIAVRPRNSRVDMVVMVPYEDMEYHNGSHIPFAFPDLSDQEGTTGREDRHPLH